MKKILLVDDEPDIIELLKYNLKSRGYEILTAANGNEALQRLSGKPDLIVLDVLMPVMNGFDTCKKIRQSPGFEQTPIIFLTAKVAESDEVQGLQLGAVHYIHKPVSINTFLARVKNTLQNASGETKHAEEKLSIGGLVIDRASFIVAVDGKELVFAKKEFELLYYLAKHPGSVHTREQLLRKVWGEGVFVGDRTVDVHIRKIREKLDEHADVIETLKGVGYRFKI